MYSSRMSHTTKASKHSVRKPTSKNLNDETGYSSRHHEGTKRFPSAPVTRRKQVLKNCSNKQNNQLTTIKIQSDSCYRKGYVKTCVRLSL